ncbi:MAG: hypothetical protein M3137_07585 [Actinomycetota bacterium]|nr:hypothetical protein [Actinomycetota bacterium]
MNGAQVNGYFAELGRATSQRWTTSGRSGVSLPDVAEWSLTEIEVPAAVTPTAVLAEAARSSSLPEQTQRGDPFGQPPLVLHREPDFYVQALTWMDGTTEIHQHGFAGAFKVLAGKSLHVTYDFSLSERLGEDRLVVGTLTMGEPEVLHPGDVRRIDPGDQFIHALFHLEKPTVTAVVRNRSSGLALPQYSYRRPGFGFDSQWKDNTWSKRLASIDSLFWLDRQQAASLVHQMIGDLPTWEGFHLVNHWWQNYGLDATTVGLIDDLVERESVLCDVFAASFAEEARVRRVLGRRGFLRELHQRLVLALVANLPDPRTVLRVIGQLFPGRDAGVLLGDWVAELASPALRGISGVNLSADRQAELRRALRLLPGADGSVEGGTSSTSRLSLLAELFP